MALSTEQSLETATSLPVNIEYAQTDEQIAATFDVMRQLRPHLEREAYVPLVRSLMASDRFHLVALLDEGTVRAVAGYRIMTMLYCGRRLLDWLKEEGRREGCAELQLISRVVREQAHRFYFREGFGIECFHFRAKL